MGERKDHCRGCGSPPVNHRSVYFDATATAFLNDWMVLFSRTPILKHVLGFLRFVICMSEPYLMHLLHILTGARTNTDLGHVRTPRAASLWREAIRRGIRMEQLVFFGIYTDSFRVRRNNHWVYFENLPIAPHLLVRAFPYSDDKLLFKQFLMKHQIPCARGHVSRQLPEAQRLRMGLQVPLVVKPRIGTNSRHTTPLVHTDAEFQSAFDLAHELCREVLFEEYLYGHLCRATVVDGVLVGFLESKQPEVMGDGVRSIGTLITEKNFHKPERAMEIVLSKENEAHLMRQGYTFESILEGGKTVQVSQYPGRGSGGENREILHEVHPQMREIVERTARLMKSPVVGFDLIIDNPKESIDGKRWGILEANTVPFIQIHDDPLYGEPSNVAAAVWDLWLRSN